MPKSPDNLVTFNIKKGEEHFKRVHGPIARGEVNARQASKNQYSRLGVRYVGVLGQIASLSELYIGALENHKIATNGLEFTEAIRVISSGNLEGWDMLAANAAVTVIGKSGKKIDTFTKEKDELERLYGLISEPWPVSARPVTRRDRPPESKISSTVEKSIPLHKLTEEEIGFLVKVNGALRLLEKQGLEFPINPDNPPTITISNGIVLEEMKLAGLIDSGQQESGTLDVASVVLGMTFKSHEAKMLAEIGGLEKLTELAVQQTRTYKAKYSPKVRKK